MFLKKILFLLFILITMSFATHDSFWTSTGLNYVVSTDDDGDYIQLYGNNRDYKMYAKDVTPAKFALTANTLRDFLINDSNCALHLDHTDNKINMVQLAGK